MNDLDTRLVMHPHLPTMLGTDLKDYRDAHGKAVFVDIVDAGAPQGEGYLTYYGHAARERRRRCPRSPT